MDLFCSNKRRFWRAWCVSVIVAVSFGSMAVWAQDTAPLVSSDLYDKTEFLEQDCGILDGNTAPLNRLTRIKGGLALSNLNLTYLGKPLHKLTNDDFRILPALLIQCKNSDPALAKYQAKRLRALVQDARSSYERSIAWFQKIKSEVLRMTGTLADIRRIHDLESQLPGRSLQVTSAEMTEMAAWLNAQRDLLYQKKPADRRGNGVGLFDPGPSLPPGSPD